MAVSTGGCCEADVTTVIWNVSDASSEPSERVTVIV
jgi:hypothetical protein